MGISGRAGTIILLSLVFSIRVTADDKPKATLLNSLSFKLPDGGPGDPRPKTTFKEWFSQGQKNQLSENDSRPVRDGWDALERLKRGNSRFSSGGAAHPLQDATRVKELTKGQKPHSIVISCSDSRVPPEIIFDQGLGEVFSVRAAGQVLSAAAVASVEYAVEHLGAKLIVVMGHDSCGAVKLAISVPEGTSGGSADIDRLLAEIRPHIRDHIGKEDSGENLAKAISEQVNGVVKDLVNRSKIIRAAVESKKVIMAEAVYRLNSGEVDFGSAGILGAQKVAKPKKQQASRNETVKKEVGQTKAEGWGF